MNLFGAGPARLQRKKKTDATEEKTSKPPGWHRMQSDMSSLELTDGVKMEFPEKDDIMNFNVFVVPFDGYWKSATFNFKFAVPDDYPYTPPKITCLNKVCVLAVWTFVAALSLLWSDLSPEHRLEWRSMSQYSTQGLEARARHASCHPWSHLPFPRAQPRRSAKRRYVVVRVTLRVSFSVYYLPPTPVSFCLPSTYHLPTFPPTYPPFYQTLTNGL